MVRVTVWELIVVVAWSLFSGPATTLKFCVLPKATVEPPKVTVCNGAEVLGGVLSVITPVAVLIPFGAITVFGAMPAPVTICPTVSVPASAGESVIFDEVLSSVVE